MTDPKCFDARLDLRLEKETRTTVLFGRTARPARLVPYASVGDEEDRRYVRVCADPPAPLRWMDEFQVLGGAGGGGRGVVLHPDSPDPKSAKPRKRLALLRLLSAGEREMIEALTVEGGVRGVSETEILAFARLPRERLEDLARSLEEEGRVRILSFSPVALVASGSLDFLAGRILSFLERWHEAHPDLPGMDAEALREKSEAAPRVFTLALKTLEKDGGIRVELGKVRRSGFQARLSAQDEETLRRLEELAFQGDPTALSLDQLQVTLRLTPEKLERLLSVLTESRKVVRGKDGFFVQSGWLGEIVAKVRAQPKREISISDFKAITGLSRKYAIPLLELLDEMGVTRRVGETREVLPPPKPKAFRRR